MSVDEVFVQLAQRFLSRIFLLMMLKDNDEVCVLKSIQSVHTFIKKRSTET